MLVMPLGNQGKGCVELTVQHPKLIRRYTKTTQGWMCMVSFSATAEA